MLVDARDRSRPALGPAVSEASDLARTHLTAIVAALVILSTALVAATPGTAGELRAIEPRAAQALELPDLEGARRSLLDWRGEVVLLAFWAGWCQPCVEEMPGIQRLAERMRGQPFAVVGVNVAEMPRRVAHTVARLGLEFTVLLDADGAAFRAWGGQGLPTSVLIDRSGTLRYLGLGPLEWDGVEAVTAIDGLLREGDSDR